MKIIVNESENKVKVSPYILGNFVECGFGRQTNGMWAEKIFNRSFQQIPPYKDITWHWLSLNREQYNENAPFWHSGYEEYNWEVIKNYEKATEYTVGTESHKGFSSFMVINDKEGEKQGLKQKRIYINRNEKCKFEIFAGFLTDYAMKLIPPLEGVTSAAEVKYESRELKIELLSEDGGKKIFKGICELKPVQSHFTMEIDPGEFSGFATLCLSFKFAGTLLLSWCSLMPLDSVNGWRKDVVEKLKEVGVPVLRFPGGCYTTFFNWREWAVPRNERKALPSFFWGGLDENDTGIDEFLDLCEATGAQPQICINMMTSNAFEAAQLVEYCNGSDDSSMGKLREFIGIKRNMKVKIWEMDNEAARKWSPMQYAEKVVEFAVKMREVDPDIFIMMEYYTFGVENLKPMLQIAGKHIDAVIHRNTDKELIGFSNSILSEYNKVNNTSVVFVNTEWLSEVRWPVPFNDGDVPHDFNMGSYGRGDYKKSLSYRQISWFYALNAAGIISDFVNFKDDIYLANFNNCVNTWGQNIIEASKEDAWLSLCGEVFKLFADVKGKEVLEITLPKDVNIKACACKDEDGRKILFFINYSAESYTLEIEGKHSEYKVKSLFCDDPIGKKKELNFHKSIISGANNMNLPGYSVSKITYY